MTHKADIEAAQLDIDIGGRLRQARRAAGLSQAQLGEALGSSADGTGPKLDWNLCAVPGADRLLEAFAAIDSPAQRNIVVELSRRLAEEAD